MYTYIEKWIRTSIEFIDKYIKVEIILLNDRFATVQWPLLCANTRKTTLEDSDNCDW